MTQKKKTVVNFIVSFFTQALTVALGLVVPRIILTHYGSDTNGLTNTIGQVFTYIALLEAGISAAARNAFYKPIKENKKEEISFVASLAKRYYRKITIIYFLVVLALSFISPLIFKTDVDYWTICIYVLFEGMTSVVSFYFINTWSTFLKSNGDTYIINILALLSKILCYIVKITMSLQSINISLIQVGYFAVSLIQLLLYYLIMKKKYGWIKYNLDTGDKKLPDKNANLISEIAWVVFSSTDMIVLSIFVSTSLSSVYSVYNMVFFSLNALLNAVYQSINYHLGQTFNSGDVEKYKKMHDLFNSAFVCGICLLMSVCYFLIIPFVKLYTKGVNDINYIHPLLPILFCLVQIFSWSRYVSGNLIGISFRLKPAIKVNVAEAIINLFLSVILVNFLGIEGVLLATVVALPLKVVYCTYVSDIIILKRKPFKTLIILLVNYSVFGLSVLISHVVNIKLDSYPLFLMWGLILFTIEFIIFVIANSLANKDLFKTFMGIFKRT